MDRVIDIKTFTCQYNPKEDRLVLSINYKEYEKRVDFWITRSFLLKLLPHFSRFVAVENDKKEMVKNQNNSVSPTDNSTYILTYKKPLLLESVDFKEISNGMEITLKNLEYSTYCRASLSFEDFSRFINLILNSAPNFEWGVPNSI